MTPMLFFMIHCIVLLIAARGAQIRGIPGRGLVPNCVTPANTGSSRRI